MERDLLLLSGPPACGKDTITQALGALDGRFRLFPKLKVGTGRSQGYRMILAEGLQGLQTRGLILQRHERYGNTYAVDAPGLDEMWRRGDWPVIHVGRRANLDAFAPFRLRALSVLLWASEAVTRRRLEARDPRDVARRMAAWREEIDDLAGDGPERCFDMAFDTGEAPPILVAEAIRTGFRVAHQDGGSVAALLARLRPHWRKYGVRHADKTASSAAPVSCAKGAPTSIETSAATYRPLTVNSRPSATREVVLPTCRGACSTKYPCCSMSRCTCGSRRSTGSI
jgi:guanylate kinase